MALLTKRDWLGNTGLKVSQLCFGTLALGPAQYNLPLDKAHGLIKASLEAGVNFFDASEFYGVYPHLRCLSEDEGIVISSRSYASTKAEMTKSLETARKGLGRDKVEIFGLHEQESGLTLKGHREALEYLAESREKGVIDAVSVSTHYVSCVKSASLLSEVDVIFAILNVEGLGIPDGTRHDMEEALAFAHYMGKGIYIMKALGGGHLYKRAYEAMRYVSAFPYKHSVCVGIKDTAELEFACKVLGGDISDSEREQLESKVQSSQKRLIVEDWCEGCGLCQEKCGFSAISIVNGKAVVDESKCMLCGYCARVCKHFCLKVV